VASAFLAGWVGKNRTDQFVCGPGREIKHGLLHAVPPFTSTCVQRDKHRHLIQIPSKPYFCTNKHREEANIFPVSVRRMKPLFLRSSSIPPFTLYLTPFSTSTHHIRSLDPRSLISLPCRLSLQLFNVLIRVLHIAPIGFDLLNPHERPSVKEITAYGGAPLVLFEHGSKNHNEKGKESKRYKAPPSLPPRPRIFFHTRWRITSENKHTAFSLLLPNSPFHSPRPSFCLFN
jgi:hypothetical protein